MFYIVCVLLFFISPLLGVLSAFIHVLIKKKVTNNDFLLFIVLFALLLGILNSGKIPDSDLLIYELWFYEVKNYSFFDYLFYLGREPFFFFYNYIIYYSVVGSFELYLLLHTVLCYIIMGYAMLRMHNTFKTPRVNLITCLLVLFLFPNLFTLSIHLIRQFLATSLLLLFIVEVTFYNKKKIILFIIAFLIHTSSILMGVLYLMKKLKSNKNVLMLVVIILSVFSYFVFKLADSVFQESSGTNMLNYGLSRIQNRALFEDLQEKLSIINFMLFFFIVFVFYQLKNRWKVKGSAALLYVSLMFLIFISVNYSDTEFALRFSFYMYFLFPIAVYFFLNIWKIHKYLSDEKLVPLVFLIIFSAWFIYKLYNGAWQYQHIERVLFLGFL